MACCAPKDDKTRITTLNCGIGMPKLGFGVAAPWKMSPDIGYTEEWVKDAVKIGFRYFDSAPMFRSKEEYEKGHSQVRGLNETVWDSDFFTRRGSEWQNCWVYRPKATRIDRRTFQQIAILHLWKRMIDTRTDIYPYLELHHSHYDICMCTYKWTNTQITALTVTNHDICSCTEWQMQPRVRNELISRTDQPEAEVGKALKDLMTEKKMKRKEFFVASSVGNTFHSKAKASSLLKQFHLPARFD